MKVLLLVIILIDKLLTIQMKMHIVIIHEIDLLVLLPMKMKIIHRLRLIDVVETMILTILDNILPDMLEVFPEILLLVRVNLILI